MKRSLVISLVATVAITIIVFAATLGAGWAPKLGLDLAGGSEVVYKPAHSISSAEMDTTVNVIRNRIDGAGVSGATVDSQGGNVVVQFPGVKNPQALIRLIGTTAQLYFRPVLCGAPAFTKPAKGKAAPDGPAALVWPVRHHRGEFEREHHHRAAGEQHPPQPRLRALPEHQERRPHPDRAAPVRPPGRGPAVRALRPGPVATQGHGHRLGRGPVRHPEQPVGGELQPQAGHPVGHRGPGELPPVRGHRPRRLRGVGAAHPTQLGLVLVVPGQGADQRELHPGDGQDPRPAAELRLAAGEAERPHPGDRVPDAGQVVVEGRAPGRHRRAAPGAHLHDPLLPGPRRSWW